MKKPPRILLYDIETSPNIGYTWGRWEQNVIEFKKEWELLSFAFKWLGDKTVRVCARPDYKDETDKSLTKALWELIDEADIVIAHNGDQFDQKKAKAKFIEHRLGPPSPYKSIDTKKIAKSQFAFNSNSLNDLGQLLKLGKKLPTGGFSLWLGCMAGDKKSWQKMKKYNKMDVALLEKVYLALRAWHPNHPNVAVYRGEPKNCPSCGSRSVVRRGVALTKTSTFERMQCKDCHRWYQGNKIKQQLKIKVGRK